MKQIGITGSRGVIGRELTTLMKAKGYQIREFEGRVENKNDVKKFVKGLEGVIHLAAKQGKGSMDEFMKVNRQGAENVARETKRGRMRMVNISTIMVKLDNGDKSCYVISKRAGARAAKEIYPGVITVYPTMVINDKNKGPGGLSGLIWKLVGGGKQGGVMAMVGKKERLMNIISLKNMAKGILRIYKTGQPGGDYILSGEEISCGEYLKRLGNRWKFRIPEIMAKIILGQVPAEMDVKKIMGCDIIEYRSKVNLG